MIAIGTNDISNIYIGDNLCSAVYAGDEQIYPMNLGTLTGISLENLTWVTDVDYTGGTATSANCSFDVYAYYDSGKRKRVTKDSTITGSLVVPATTADTREMVGTLTLTATYSGFTDSDSVDVYQKALKTAPDSITTNRTYFNLNYSATSTTKLYIKFKPETGGCGMQGAVASDYRNSFVFGRVYTGQRNQFSINCYYNSTGATETKFTVRYYCGSSFSDYWITNVETNNIYEAYLSATGATFNGTNISFSNTFTGSPIYLAGGIDTCSNGYCGYGGIFTIYSFQIYENNVLVKDYIPWINDNGYGCIKETIGDTVIDANTPSLVTANYDL